MITQKKPGLKNETPSLSQNEHSDNSTPHSQVRHRPYQTDPKLLKIIGYDGRIDDRVICEGDSCRAKVRVLNRYGVHARPAAHFVQIASLYESSVEVENPAGERISGKSIMGLMTLEAGNGTFLNLYASGSSDGGECLSYLLHAFDSRFGEEE